MGEEIVVEGELFKLRAGSPMPIGVGEFVTHTFKAERTKVDTYLYTNSLKSSTQFRGQSTSEDSEHDYVSANFSRMLDKGGESYQGSVKHAPVSVDEDAI